MLGPAHSKLSLVALISLSFAFSAYAAPHGIHVRDADSSEIVTRGHDDVLLAQGHAIPGELASHVLRGKDVQPHSNFARADAPKFDGKKKLQGFTIGSQKVGGGRNGEYESHIVIGSYKGHPSKTLVIEVFKGADTVARTKAVQAEIDNHSKTGQYVDSGTFFNIQVGNQGYPAVMIKGFNGDSKAIGESKSKFKANTYLPNLSIGNKVGAGRNQEYTSFALKNGAHDGQILELFPASGKLEDVVKEIENHEKTGQYVDSGMVQAADVRKLKLGNEAMRGVIIKSLEQHPPQ